MTDHERIDELERKVALLQAKQDEQTTRLNQVVSRLTFLEARQYRLMKELGIEPTALESPTVAQTDAQEILRTIPVHRLN
ncbi:hypothetical protein G8759_34615 [Spirosoma aureum]|uniref:Uncharacterized protein n=1 Tax=Spirosoma aureum TaxID=2692134 RepID=A0A6G9AY55_9BACT|nr:hypothetical protein [Spirosoma aureum]QIP17411.1 hypothetical protein G8759_34615 [Spirosoma aureum]